MSYLDTHPDPKTPERIAWLAKLIKETPGAKADESRAVITHMGLTPEQYAEACVLEDLDPGQVIDELFFNSPTRSAAAEAGRETAAHLEALKALNESAPPASPATLSTPPTPVLQGPRTAYMVRPHGS